MKKYLPTYLAQKAGEMIIKAKTPTMPEAVGVFHQKNMSSYGTTLSILQLCEQKL